MAVCNLFNNLNSPTGNFMLFSQYVEDITRNYTEGNNWKIIPSRFVALDIDYSKINKSLVLNNGKDTMNTGIPKYFQNYFENACAYGKTHYSDWAKDMPNIKNTSWTPTIARNLFWNAMFDAGFVSAVKYGSETSDVKYVPEVMYYGDISMHSYSSHQGMGYGEIYCYIPTNAEKMNCRVECITDMDINGRKYDSTNNSIFLEGHTDKYVEDYPQNYFYNRDFSMSFDDINIDKLVNGTESKYNINTIVVLYTIFVKLDNTWVETYANIPLGMYIAGNFDDTGNLSNTITKYVTTNYGTGTSYGLRICTRFSASNNGVILTNSDVTDDASYTNVCQLMTAMNENLSKMLEISKSAVDNSQQYKDILSMIKNNKNNVPYVRNINGVDCWFVNGKFVSAVAPKTIGVGELAESTIKQRIENLSDNNPDNDYSFIEDPNGDDILEVSNTELAEKLGMYDIMNPMPVE